MTALASITAYYWIFSGFGFWDDEGSLLVSVKSISGGRETLWALFRTTAPCTFYHQWLLHAASGVPATHDGFRIGTLVSWLLTALGLRVDRSAADSITPASLGHAHLLVLGFIFSSKFTRPSSGALHPADRFAGGERDFSRRSEAANRGHDLCRGFYGGAAFDQSQCGALLRMLAVALAILSSVPKTIFSRLLFVSTATASLILPFILMKAHLHQAIAERYCFVVVASTLAMLFFLDAPRPRLLFLRDFGVAVGAFTCVAAGALLIFDHGHANISAQHPGFSRVLDNLRVERQRGTVVLCPYSGWWIYRTLFGLAAAIFFAKSPEESRTRCLLLCLKSIFLPLAALAPLFEQSLLGSMTSFCWLVLCGD